MLFFKVGSWLLTKEACAALSSVIIAFPGKIDYDVMSMAGDLLISTLTSLKHQGAAFAAHKSLQKICARCHTENGESGVRSLPSKWSSRLMFEISCPDLVRDSTLRRSTGYGELIEILIFLSLFTHLNIPVLLFSKRSRYSFDLENRGVFWPEVSIS